MPHAPDPVIPDEILSDVVPQSVLASVESSEPQAKSLEDDIFSKIERLADLHARGILTADEFQAKKTDLLSRL